MPHKVAGGSRKKESMKKRSINQVSQQFESASKAGFDALPNNAFVREAELVRTETNPTAPLPFSTHTLWRKVRDGSFPRPSKLAPRVTAWLVQDVRDWMRACAA